MRVGLDVDGCFYDFHEAVRSYLVDNHGYRREDLPDPTVWNFQKEDWKMDSGLFYKLCARGINDGHIFGVGEPAEGAVAAIRRMRKKGHTIHICTNRSIGSMDAANTYKWLKEHKITYDSLTFAADKTIIDVDIFLEDKHENFYALEEAGTRAFLFDQPYNRDIDTAYRVHSWKEFADAVIERGNKQNVQRAL